MELARPRGRLMLRRRPLEPSGGLALPTPTLLLALRNRSIRAKQIRAK